MVSVGATEPRKNPAVCPYLLVAVCYLQCWQQHRTRLSKPCLPEDSLAPSLLLHPSLALPVCKNHESRIWSSFEATSSRGDVWEVKSSFQSNRRSGSDASIIKVSVSVSYTIVLCCMNALASYEWSYAAASSGCGHSCITICDVSQRSGVARAAHNHSVPNISPWIASFTSAVTASGGTERICLRL